MQSRRQFIRDAGVISLVPAIPSFLAKAVMAGEQPTSDGRMLVVIQLDGGNDGINTVVPFKDEGYAKHRSKLRLPDDTLIKLGDDMAFHPRLRSASELFNDHRLSVVHGVGYPNPNRSHFESMGIWHAGTTDGEQRSLGNGWLGDAISLEPFSPGPHAFHIGDGTLPVALRGRRCTATSMNGAADLKLKLRDLEVSPQSNSNATQLKDFVTRSVNQAYVSARELADASKADSSARYPQSKLGQRLKLISQTIKAGAQAKVYYTSQSGYDTHAAQLNAHANLLGDLSISLKLFMDDLKQAGLEDRIAVLVFSEFGRRVAENASLGTDHGTAGPMFLLGTKLKQQLFGVMPSLSDLDAGDLKHTADFRDVYASVLTDWLGFKKPDVLANYGQSSYFKV